MRYIELLNRMILFFVVFCAVTCKSANDKGDTQPENVNDILFLDISDEHIITPPIELLFDLDSIQLTFKRDRVNPHTNIDKYVTQRAKMINMGVYMADFSYLSVLKERVLLMDYMSNIKKLADELKIFGLVNDDLYRRVKRNIDVSDSLYHFSVESYNKLIEILESTNRQNVLVNITIGGFIESFYLFIEPVKEEAQFEEMSVDLENYQFILKEYYEIASKIISAPFLGETVEDISGLLVYIDSSKVQVQDKPEEMQENDKLLFKGEKQFELTYEEFLELKKEVLRIREHFITLK